jgi:hypothetical protein
VTIQHLNCLLKDIEMKYCVIDPPFCGLKELNRQKFNDMIPYLAQQVLKCNKSEEFDCVIGLSLHGPAVDKDNIRLWKGASLWEHLNKQGTDDSLKSEKITQFAYYMFSREDSLSDVSTFKAVRCIHHNFFSKLTQVNDNEGKALTKNERAKKCMNIAKHFLECQVQYKSISENVWIARRYFQRALSNGSLEAKEHLDFLLNQSSQPLRDKRRRPDEELESLVCCSALDGTQGDLAVVYAVERLNVTANMINYYTYFVDRYLDMINNCKGDSNYRKHLIDKMHEKQKMLKKAEDHRSSMQEFVPKVQILWNGLSNINNAMDINDLKIHLEATHRHEQVTNRLKIAIKIPGQDPKKVN